MPDPLAPSALSPSGPTDVPDPEFWGPPRPGRRRGRAGPARPPASFGVLDRTLDRVRGWQADPRAGVAALLVVALVAGVAWYRIGMGSAGGDEGAGASAVPASTTGPDPSGGPTDSSPPGERDEPVTVHVAGAVTRPGVVELPAGARVVDALEAAGGAGAEADLDRLNLAALLVDGQQVLVQRIGDPPLPADAGTGDGAPPGADGPTSELINLNTATKTQLETLPGIGPVLAEAIIDERDRRGGFRAVEELRSVSGIGDKRFADLEGLVTV